MNTKYCPECSFTEFSKKALWLHTLVGNKLVCRNCGARLKLKVNTLPYLINGFVTSVIFLGSVFLGYYFQSWLVFFAVVLIAIVVDSLFYHFGRLAKVGFK